VLINTKRRRKSADETTKFEPDGEEKKAEDIEYELDHIKKKCEWPSGDKYEGEFMDDKLDGWGKYLWANGTVYEGRWKDGKKNGEGKQIWK
jgi:hypothetical protein